MKTWVMVIKTQVKVMRKRGVMTMTWVMVMRHLLNMTRHLLVGDTPQFQLNM